MTFLSTNPIVSRIVILTQTQLSAPTAAQIADYSAIYQLDIAPYTRYHTDGTALQIMTQSQATIDALIQANDSLGAMAPAVQTLIDAASVTDRARNLHTGTDAASNVIVALNAKTLEVCMTEIYAALAGGGPSAPQITTDPTISDTTPNVAQTLTVTPGTVTGGAHTETYFWSANGVPVTSLSTSTTYIVGSAYAGQVITVTQRSTLNTGTLYNERTSAATSVVVATVPTNSVAPTITPSGAQTVGAAYSVASLGTWADDTAATVSYQWLWNDADISGATASTYSSITGQEGGTIKLRVRKTTAQGSSVWVTSSNSSTVNGAPTLTFTAAPAFPATVTENTAAIITNATYTGGTPTFINSRVYVAESATPTQPYAVITTNPSSYLPQSDAWLLAQTGLTAIAGKTVSCDQQWLLSGTTYTSARSATKVVQAVAAGLAARTDTATYNWTQNTSVSSTRPIAGTGGTAPFTYSISPALPSGLSMTTSGAQAGYIAGTPTVTTSAVTYTVTVTDSVAATASATFTATVAAPSVTPLATLPYPVPTNMDPNSSPTYNDGDTITGSSGVILQRVADPGGSGRLVYLHRVWKNQWVQNSARVRSEKLWIGMNEYLLPNEEHWFSYAWRAKGDEWPNDTGNTDDDFQIQQSHTELSGNTQSPWSLAFSRGGFIRRYTASFCVDPPTGAPFFQNAPSTTSMTPVVMADPTIKDTWYKVVYHIRPGWQSSHNPIFEVWEKIGAGSWNRVVNYTGFNTYNITGSQFIGGDYPRIGLHKWDSTNFVSGSTLALYMTSLYHGEGVNLFNEAAESLTGL
jgi:hypothetical protein